MAAKTLGLSGRGRHIHSTRPLGAIRQLTSQSDRKAYSAMGGKGLETRGPPGCASGSSDGPLPSPLTEVLIAWPRSASLAFRATFPHSRAYADDPPDALENLVWRAHPADDLYRDALPPVVVEHRLGELVVLVHPLGDRLARVVGPALDRGPMQQALDQVLLRHVQREDAIDPVALSGQHRIQRLGLAQGAWKAVEQHAGAGFRLGKPAPHDIDDQLVRHEVAGGHDAPGLPAGRRSLSHLGAKDVAGREMLEVEVFFDPGRLGAFAASRWAKDDADHARRILRRLRHHVLACSASRAWIAGSGPAGSPSSLSAIQRRVTSTYRSVSVQPGSCSSTL